MDEARRATILAMNRKLSLEESDQFARWAKDNFKPEPANPLWHPVVRYTWFSLLEEYAHNQRVMAQEEVELLIEQGEED